MTPHHLVTILTMLLAAAPASAQAPAKQGDTTFAQAPPDWEKTKARILDLGLAGKHQEIAAIAESLVATYPRFADGHFWLGSAYENMARAVARTNPARASSLFETAATRLRHAFDLGGGEQPDATIRGLIDLYEYALPRPDTWKATILDAVSRYPAQPASHWYVVQLVLREGRMTDLDAAFRAARAGLPSTPPDARLQYAELLVGLGAKSPSPDGRRRVLGEALALAEETLKTHPTDRFGRRAQSIKEEVGSSYVP